VVAPLMMLTLVLLRNWVATLVSPAPMMLRLMA
jgi:hypothetical protein